MGEENIDLLCTLHDRIYEENQSRNRAKTAYRINIDVPPKYADFIEVNPTMLFVQGGMSQDLNMKFTPKEICWRRQTISVDCMKIIMPTLFLTH